MEVKKDGVWGTVRDDGFGMTEASVACRAAGFGSAIATQAGSEYGRGIGPVHYQNVRYVIVMLGTIIPICYSHVH